jgi:hypothetical protein
LNLKQRIINLENKISVLEQTTDFQPAFSKLCDGLIQISRGTLTETDAKELADISTEFNKKYRSLIEVQKK